MSPGKSDQHVPKERHPFGIEPEQTATNERARPVPYFAGTRRLSVTWIGPAYNQRVEEVMEEGGAGGKAGGKGGGGDERVIGHNYYANCAALVCLVHVDALQEIGVVEV